MTDRQAHHWYARPVLFVADLERAVRFYVDTLGFPTKWRVDTVCQVDRRGCEIVRRSIPTAMTWWGYDAIRIADPDGNELLFPLDETNDSERQA